MEKGLLTKSGEAVLFKGKVHRGTFHGIVENGGELVFKESPFKVRVTPSGDFSTFELIGCGTPPKKNVYYQKPTKKVEIKKTEIKDEVIL